MSKNKGKGGNPNAGIEVKFVEGVKPVLPKGVYDDRLAVSIQTLLMRVKTDHSRSGFAIDVNHYAPLVAGIVKFARDNGYEKVPVVLESIEEDIEDEEVKENEDVKDTSNEDVDWDNITD